MNVNTQDIEILNECKELIIAFKHHLSIINREFLTHHIIGVIRKGTVYTRDPDDRWSYKNFCADFDDAAKSQIGIDKQTGHFHVTSTNFRDYYLYDLIYSMRIETGNKYHVQNTKKNKFIRLEKVK